MNEPRLELNGRKYTSQQLTDSTCLVSAQSEFEKSTLTFCYHWLSGKNEFTLTTSGSTGTPKSIVLKRHQMEASAQLTVDALQLKPGYNALVCLDTKFIAGQMMLVRSFLIGMNIIATEPAANPLKNITNQIDFAAFVPYQIETILEEGYSQKLDILKCAIIGGAAVSESLKIKLQKVKASFYATYGMTETISHIALQKLNDTNVDERFNVVGNTKISQDERGCLIVDAEYLDEEVITNDLVNIVDSSSFYWLGRFDNVINSGGVKISPESVERMIQFIFEENNLSNRFFVAGIPDAKLGQRGVLFIEGSPLTQNIQDDLLNNLSTRVSKFELPKEIKFIPAFSQTLSGKVNRLETIKLNKV